MSNSGMNLTLCFSATAWKAFWKQRARSDALHEVAGGLLVGLRGACMKLACQKVHFSSRAHSLCKCILLLLPFRQFDEGRTVPTLKQKCCTRLV